MFASDKNQNDVNTNLFSDLDFETVNISNPIINQNNLQANNFGNSNSGLKFFY